jgi:hypothetical protein
MNTHTGRLVIPLDPEFANLPLVNQQVREETLAICYSASHFRIPYEDLANFADVIGEQKSAMVQTLVLDLPSIPSNDLSHTPMDPYKASRELLVTLKRLYLAGSLKNVVIKYAGDPDIYDDCNAARMAAYLYGRLKYLKHSRKVCVWYVTKRYTV